MISVPPVKVFVPLKVRVPAPTLVSVLSPEMMPVIVPLVPATLLLAVSVMSLATVWDFTSRLPPAKVTDPEPRALALSTAKVPAETVVPPV